MLVLSRRKGEKIVIGNEIVIEVLAVGGDGVRLGISAPGSTSVHRYEVFTEIQEANRSAESAVNELEQTTLEQLSAFLNVNPK
ncbi:MAG: carbon storage regulator CsrA [Acidobacteria bacterium]|nr:carbon storage regulator CsrA [Acidobacteriota bacterium]